MRFELGNFLLRLKDGGWVILEAFLSSMYRLSGFMELVLNETDTCYRTVKVGNGNKQVVTPIGKHYDSLPLYMTLFSRKYKFHPASAFYFAQYMQHRISQFPFYGLMSRNAAGETYAEVADDFVAVMRKEAVRIGLKKMIHNWESKATKNHERLEYYLELLFSLTTRLMVVRVDLNYKQAVFSMDEVMEFDTHAHAAHYADLEALAAWGEARRHPKAGNSAEDDSSSNLGAYETFGLPSPQLFKGRVSLEQVKRDRFRFFEKLKADDDLSEDLLGYMWRIDCAREAGFHMHVAFFFNGHDVKKHEYYADLLGQLWLETVGEDVGYFFNCHNRKAELEAKGQWALGEVRIDDLKKRQVLLDDALGYFTKDEKILQYVLEDNSHMFGTVLLKRPGVETRGRPRKVGDKTTNAKVVAKHENNLPPSLLQGI